MADEKVSVEITAIDRAGEVFRGLSRTSNDLAGSLTSLLTPTKLLGGLFGYELIRGLQSSVQEFTKFAFQVRDLSYLSGATAKDVSVLITGLDDLGVEANTVERAVAFMSRAMEDGSPALAQLGISVEDLRTKQQTGVQTLYQVIDALGAMPAGYERNAIAAQIFGRQWTQLVPALALGTDTIRKLGEENAKTGKTMSEEGIQAAFAYQQALRDLGNAVEGLQIQVGKDLLPALTEVLKAMGGPAVATARLFLGVFQEVDATATLLAASLLNIVRPFAWLSDQVRLTTDAYAQWTEWATTASIASRDLADKGLKNLTLQTDANTEATNKSTGADKGRTAAIGEGNAHLQQRLKYEVQLAQLNVAALTASATTEEERLAVAIAAVNLQRKTTLADLESRKTRVKSDLDEIGTLRTAANAAADAQIEKARRDSTDRMGKEAVEAIARQRQAYETVGFLDVQSGEGFEVQAGDVENARAVRRTLDAEREDSFRTLAEQIRSASFDYDDYESNRLVTYQATQGEIDAAKLAGTQRDRERLVTDQQTEERLRQETVTQDKAALLQRYTATTDFFGKVKLGMELSTKNYETESQRMLRITNDFAQAATRSLDDLYFSVLTGKFKSFGDFLNNFWQGMARVASNQMAQSTMSALFGGGGGSGLLSLSSLSSAGSALMNYGSTAVSGISSALSWLGSFDTGMWKVPEGRSAGSAYTGGWAPRSSSAAGAAGVAALHPGEMVVPPDIAEILRRLVAINGGSNFAGLASLLTGGGGRGAAGQSSGAYGAMSQAERSALGPTSLGGITRGTVTGMLGLLGYSNLGGLVGPATIGGILGIDSLMGMLGITNVGYVSPTEADFQSAFDYGGPIAEAAARADAAFGMSNFADTRQAAALQSAMDASAAPRGDPDTSFGGYGYGDPGYGDAPGMGDSTGQGPGGSTSDSDSGGHGAAGDGSMNARGTLFNTRGRTRMTVGEAGSETVAVLRNPREVAMGGGGSFTIQIVNHGVIGDKLPDNLMREIQKWLQRRENRRIPY